MYEKYVDSIPGTTEYMLYTFLAAYITQDIKSIDEAISDFEQTAADKSKKMLVKAIDEFLALDYPEYEKAAFIEELSSGWIEANTFKEQLLLIRDTFI